MGLNIIDFRIKIDVNKFYKFLSKNSLTCVTPLHLSSLTPHHPSSPFTFYIAAHFSPSHHIKLLYLLFSSSYIFFYISLSPFQFHVKHFLFSSLFSSFFILSHLSIYLSSLPSFLLFSIMSYVIYIKLLSHISFFYSISYPYILSFILSVHISSFYPILLSSRFIFHFLISFSKLIVYFSYFHFIFYLLILSFTLLSYSSY